MQLGDNDIVIYVSGNIADYQAKMQQVKAITSATTASVSSTLGRSLVTTSEMMRRAGNTMVGAAGAASVGIVYPFVRAATEIFNTGKDFDLWSQRTVSVFDLFGQNVDEVKEKLQQFAYSLAGTTMFDATEIMESMYGMAQAGMQVDDIYAIMPEVVNLATAQMTDLDTAFKLIFATMSAYNMEATDATRVTHAIAAAASASVLDVNDLVYALKYINPTFAALGYSLEEGLAMAAMLRDLSFTGQNAGRILRDAFTDLIAPTAEAASIIRKYNISVYENGDEINGLVAEYYSAAEALDLMKSSTKASNEEIQRQKDFILELQRQMQGLDKSSEQYKSLKRALDEALFAEKVMKNEVSKSNAEIEKQTAKVKKLEKQISDFSVTGIKAPAEIFAEFSRAMEEGMTEGELASIFGKQSYAAMSQMAKENEKYGELLGKITYNPEVGSEAARQAEIVLSSTASQYEIFTSHLSTMASEIYNSVDPALNTLFATLNANVESIKNFVIMVAQNFIPIIQGIVDHIIGAIQWFNGLDESTKNLIAKVVAMGAAFTLVAVPLMLFTGIIMWSLSPFVKLTGTILSATGGFGKFGLALQALNPNAKMVGIEVLGMRQAFEKLAFSVVNINGPITVAKGALMSLITPLKTLGIGGAVQSLVLGGLSSIYGAITGVGSALFATIPAITGVVAALMPLLGWVLVIVGAVVLLWVAWKNNWFGIQEITANVIKFITDHLQVLFDFVKGTIGVIIDSFTKLFDALMAGDVNGIFNAIGNLIGGIVRLIGGLPLKFFETGIRMIADFIKGIIRAAPDVGRSLIRWVLDGGIQEFIVAAVKAAIEAGKSFVKGFIDGITGKSPEIKEKVEPVGKEVTTSLNEGIESGLPDVYSTMETGAVESVNVFKQKFDESFGKLDLKNISEENVVQFKAFELTKDIVDLSDLTEEQKQFVGEVQTIIEQNGGEIPENLKKVLDAQMKESKPFSSFHEEFRKEFDLVLYEWASYSPEIISQMKNGFRLSKDFINLEDGLQESEKQLIGFLDSVASDTGKLPEDLQKALDVKLKVNQPLEEWWGEFYQKWKDTEPYVTEPYVVEVPIRVEIVSENVSENNKVESEIKEDAKKTSLLYSNNFSEVLSGGETGTTSLRAIINGELNKTVSNAGEVGTAAADEFVKNFTTTVEDRELKVTIYPSTVVDYKNVTEKNIDVKEIGTQQDIQVSVSPTVDEAKKEQVKAQSVEDGREFVESYKSGVEEKRPELDATIDSLVASILGKLNLSETAYNLGYSFVNSYTNGVLAALPLLSSAIVKMNSIIKSAESFAGMPMMQGLSVVNNYDIDVNLNNATIRNESDIDKLADAVYERISRNAGLKA